MQRTPKSQRQLKPLLKHPAALVLPNVHITHSTTFFCSSNSDAVAISLVFRNAGVQGLEPRGKELRGKHSCGVGCAVEVRFRVGNI